MLVDDEVHENGVQLLRVLRERSQNDPQEHAAAPKVRGHQIVAKEPEDRGDTFPGKPGAAFDPRFFSQGNGIQQTLGEVVVPVEGPHEIAKALGRNNKKSRQIILPAFRFVFNS